MQQAFQRTNSSAAFQLSTNSNGQQQNKQQQQQLLKRQTQAQAQSQIQPLTPSQLVNIQQQQQYREAQAARAKLNSHKSFNLEDDLEFYPNHIDTRPKMIQRALSPYTTPTKMNGIAGFGSAHRGNGQQQQQLQQHAAYISPHLMDSPQQHHQNLHHSHHQGFNSPGPSGMARRLDVPNGLYQQSPGRHNW